MTTFNDTITEKLNGLEHFCKSARKRYFPLKMMGWLILLLAMLLTNYVALIRWPFSALFKRTSKNRQNPGKPIDVNSEQALKQAIDEGGLVMVDFTAQWCGPCLLMAPAVDAVALQYKDQIRVIKADVSLNTDMAVAYRVRGFPTIILFDNGKELSRKSTAMTQRQLSSLINEVL